MNKEQAEDVGASYEIMRARKKSDPDTLYRLYKNGDIGRELGNNYTLYSNGVFVHSFASYFEAVQCFKRLRDN